MAKKQRAIPEINAGSMADIAFLLLIFFLVTTTMDTDMGITVKLPPHTDEVPDPPPIKERNVFKVLVNSNNQLLVEEELISINQLRREAVKFITNNGDGSCQYCTGMRDPNSSDNPDKAIISLKNDRGTKYDTYMQVQNELKAAYREVREDYSQKKFGRKFDQLSPSQKEEVAEAFPQKISEAEPEDIGGE